MALGLTAATAQADIGKLAKHLHKLDPGALVGGKSIVGTKPGEQLHGVHGKPNFIIALADGQTIHGASKNDELGVGAHAQDVKIVPSNHGHSLIVGGPGSTIVAAGEGHNLIVSKSKGATIILESPNDEVIATGPDTRVICAGHANHELIEMDSGVELSKRCHGHHDKIEHLSSSQTAASATATAHSSSLIQGDGTDQSPFFTDCDPDTSLFSPECTVSSFPARTLHGLWAHEHVPAYRCYDGATQPEKPKPYLFRYGYAPFGTTLPDGVEVKGLGPVGVSITGTFAIESRPTSTGETLLREAGTRRGASSATNWTTGAASYRVILHCTQDTARGYYNPLG